MHCYEKSNHRYEIKPTGNVMQREKENGIESEQDLRKEVINKMYCHLGSSMHQIEDRDFRLRSRIRM